jgi:hypothetical protein
VLREVRGLLALVGMSAASILAMHKALKEFFVALPPHEERLQAQVGRRATFWSSDRERPSA